MIMSLRLKKLVLVKLPHNSFHLKKETKEKKGLEKEISSIFIFVPPIPHYFNPPKDQPLILLTYLTSILSTLKHLKQGIKFDLHCSLRKLKSQLGCKCR